MVRRPCGLQRVFPNTAHSSLSSCRQSLPQSLTQPQLVALLSTCSNANMHTTGEYAPMDISQRTNGMSAIVRNFPIGVISMVSPFNFPLNLTAHKVAPALAVGCAEPHAF